MIRILRVELRREWLLSKSYGLELVADHLFFILGFLILVGLFNVATGDQYSGAAQLSALIGYLLWRVAAGCMADVTGSMADDAQWGTMEQIWLSGASPASVLFARGASTISFYTIRSLIMAVIILLILRPSFTFTVSNLPGSLLLYLLTMASPFGLALFLSGLHLAFKNVNAITQPLATILLFLTGALTPLDGIPILYLLSRLLPLSIGIDLLRDLLVEGAPLYEILTSWPFVALLINTIIYLGAGLLVLRWAYQKALDDGSLAHY